MEQIKRSLSQVVADAVAVIRSKGTAPILPHGLAHRRRKNAALRARGQEPVPGLRAGVKRWARFLRRSHSFANVQIKNPRGYMHSTERRRLANSIIDDMLKEAA